MGHRRYVFPKGEKLTGKKKIEEFFKHSSSFYLEAIQVRYLSKIDSEVHQVLISVPKRKFKRAVDRNLIKRRIREAYRHHKYLLEEKHIPFLHLAFIYLASEILSFKEIEQQIIQAISNVIKKCNA
ncbi:MAG: ribonuclease P protein component [Bacteroidota bacterium]